MKREFRCELVQIRKNELNMFHIFEEIYSDSDRICTIGDKLKSEIRLSVKTNVGPDKPLGTHYIVTIEEEAPNAPAADYPIPTKPTPPPNIDFKGTDIPKDRP